MYLAQDVDCLVGEEACASYVMESNGQLGYRIRADG